MTGRSMSYTFSAVRSTTSVSFGISDPSPFPSSDTATDGPHSVMRKRIELQGVTWSLRNRAEPLGHERTGG
jgi:hypothetical protein